MKKLTYAEQLQDPRWQRKRLEIMKRDGFACRSCLNAEATLHVHHIYYSRGKMVWEYRDDALVTYCKACHEEAENAREYLLEGANAASLGQVEPLWDLAVILWHLGAPGAADRLGSWLAEWVTPDEANDFILSFQKRIEQRRSQQ